MEPPRPRSGEEERPFDADQRQPTIRRRGRSRTRSAEPCQGSSGHATHASFSHRGTITGSRVCCDHRQNPPFPFRMGCAVMSVTQSCGYRNLTEGRDSVSPRGFGCARKRTTSQSRDVAVSGVIRSTSFSASTLRRSCGGLESVTR
jgi:hypothetical protein